MPIRAALRDDISQVLLPIVQSLHVGQSMGGV